MTGEVKLNDKHTLDPKLFAKYSTYVMQDDVLFPYFTVRECFTFAARLKLRCSEEEQDQRVQKLIEDLGLEECCET